MTEKTPNTLNGEVAITIAGKAFVMRPTWKAIMSIEERTGKALTVLAQQSLVGELRHLDFAWIITAGLQGAGEPATFEKVAEMVVQTSVADMVKPVQAFLFQAVSGGKTMGEAGAPGAKAD